MTDKEVIWELLNKIKLDAVNIQKPHIVSADAIDQHGDCVGDIDFYFDDNDNLIKIEID